MSAERDTVGMGKVDLRSYAVVTGAYWADTIVDGATRLLVLFHFYNLGYTPFELASLFLFYEIFGIVTNLVGGWVAAKLGLRTTLVGGLCTQSVALSMLAFAPTSWLVLPYVMISQALSGIAKDLTKMSSKSAVKLLVPDDAHGELYKWVAILTGSKNALKGVGFFVGGLLLTVVGFHTSLIILLGLIVTALIVVLTMTRGHLATPNPEAKFRGMFSNNRSVNILAAARVFLFASRDVWFVIGVPVFMESVLGWTFWQTGAFLAVWVIGYGIVQASAPNTMRRWSGADGPDGHTATWLAFVLATLPAAIAIGLDSGLSPAPTLVIGLIVFGVVFALNSAVHSFLILRYADGDKVAMNVGFYYMANACGRLAGTLLSGALYQAGGLTWCLWASSISVLIAGCLSLLLPRSDRETGRRGHRARGAVKGLEPQRTERPEHATGSG